MPMLSIRLVAVLGAVMLLLALSAGPAAAHAALVSSDPAAGQRLATAPGLVVLRFTEPLNTRLSGATVTGPNGQRFQGAAAGAEELRVRLLTNIPGVYRVAWATVSVVDGHSLRGRFAFGVGVTVGGSAGGAADGSAATGPRLDDGLIAVGRAVEDLALLVAVGMLLLASLARRNPPLARVRPRVAVVLAVALGAGLVVVTAEAAVASAAASGLSARGVAAYLTSGVPGWARLGRVTLETVALLLASPLARWLPGGSPPWRRWGRPGQRLGIWLAVAGGWWHWLPQGTPRARSPPGGGSPPMLSISWQRACGQVGFWPWQRLGLGWGRAGEGRGTATAAADRKGRPRWASC
jgi:methionine-rich copper-binding protein CopC